MRRKEEKGKTPKRNKKGDGGKRGSKRTTLQGTWRGESRAPPPPHRHKWEHDPPGTVAQGILDLERVCL